MSLIRSSNPSMSRMRSFHSGSEIPRARIPPAKKTTNQPKFHMETTMFREIGVPLHNFDIGWTLSEIFFSIACAVDFFAKVPWTFFA